jgi:hypothetical protein
MTVVVYFYSLQGTYVRLIVSISLIFLVMHINIVNSNFIKLESDDI